MNRRIAPLLLAPAVALVVLTGCSSPTPAAPAPGAPAASAQAGAALAKQNLNPAEFAELAAQPGVTLIDVRTPAEFASGHLEGAKNIDIEGPNFDAQIAQLPKDGTYAVYCRTGNRSTAALAKMKAAGLTRSAHLAGGIVSWQGAGRPVVK